jgi:hypothetical protein
MDARSPESFLDDPHWFARGFDPRNGTVGFTQASREELADEPFLDMRWKRAGGRSGRMHLSSLVAALASKPEPQNLRFIWHTGFCCSTLLARALDMPGRNLSLCEPKLLVDAADAKRAGAFALHPDLAALPSVAFKLLSRGFGDSEAVTVKPAPAANHLLPEAAALPGARHLFLYSRCEDFVIAIARLGADGDAYTRAMVDVMRRDGIAPNWTHERTANLSPLRRAALAWHMQIAEFQTAASPDARALDCDVLLADPATVLGAADAFLGLGLGAGHAAQMVDGALFRRNAKKPGEAFDPGRRSSEYEEVRKRLGAELTEAVAWGYETLGIPRGTPPPGFAALMEKADS